MILEGRQLDAVLLRDHDGCRAALAPERLQHLDDRATARHVERRSRLIGEDDLGVATQLTGPDNALLLAAQRACGRITARQMSACDVLKYFKRLGFTISAGYCGFFPASRRSALTRPSFKEGRGA
jgi:hypothetical protein